MLEIPTNYFFSIVAERLNSALLAHRFNCYVINVMESAMKSKCIIIKVSGG